MGMMAATFKNVWTSQTPTTTKRAVDLISNSPTPIYMPPKKKSKKSSRSQDVLPQPTIDQDRQDEIRVTFQHALPKGEKSLSISAAKKCLKNLGLDSKTDEIQSFFATNDTSGLDGLEEESFVRFAITKAIQVDKAYKVFELMDQDGKGVVVLEDLERVAAELGEDISTDQLEEMVQFADGSGEGLLTAQDFVRIARKVNL